MKINAILEEFTEIRKKIIHILIILLLASLFSLSFDLNLLYNQFPKKTTLASLAFNKLRNDLLPKNIELIVTSPADAIIAQIEISIFIGILISLPFILPQLASFVSPALYKNERKFLLKMTIPAIFLFISGCIFSYFLILPFTFEFLYGYAFAMGAKPFINISSFVSYILMLTFSFGFTFNLFLIMIILTRLGLVGADTWKENFGLAIIAITVFSALITPDVSGVTQLFVMAPLIFLYFLGYLASKYIERKQPKFKSE